MNTLKLILVDDHKMFREGLKSLITIQEIATVIGEASNGKEFLELLEKQIPDVVVMDIAMPVMDGVEAARIALERNPDLKILTLSSFGDEEYYYKMIETGVKGFVMKNAGIIEFERAINDIADGESYFSNEILRRIVVNLGTGVKTKKSEDLSKREVEVLKLICQGLTNEEIAESLHLSPETIKSHRSHILEKTSTKNTASLVMYSIKNKLVEL
ncbi:MAG: response regulator transcription factor [Bacteroidota bacterium]|nr:response regulator transcription factor [Bacteroidota bacterium]